MGNLISYIECPCCKCKAFKSIFFVKDFTVSKQSFEIVECTNCTFRFTQSVPNANDIAPFYQSENYVSHSDTKDGIINKLYHAVRKFTLKQKSNLISKFTGLNNGNLLDVGAGTGAFANTMQQAGWQVVALEPDPIARKNANDLYKIELKEPENLYHLPAESYDAITLWHVLEHVHDLEGYFSIFKKILKQRGKLMIAVPNYTSYEAGVYQSFWAAYDVPRHLYHFSPKSMQALAKSSGFIIEQYKPMWFDSFYISMISEQYKIGKSNLLRAIIVGFVSNMVALFKVTKCSSIIYVLKKG